MLKNLKRKIATTFAISAILASSTFAQGINVVVDGNSVAFANQQPVVVEGRTLIPLRGVFENLGYTVSWDSNTKTATLTNGTYTVVMQAGSQTFTVNSKAINLDVPAQIMNGSMMIPLRAVGEGTGVTVNWDAATKSATITSSSVAPAANITVADIENMTLEEIAALEAYADGYLAAISPLEDLENELDSLDMNDPEVAIAVLSKLKPEVNTCVTKLKALNPPAICQNVHTLTIEAMETVLEFIDYTILVASGESTDSEEVQVEKLMEYFTKLTQLTTDLEAEADKFEALGQDFANLF